MFSEIYAWLEQFSGATYDMSSEFALFYDEMIFVDTFGWYNKYQQIENDIYEINDIIDEHEYEIPDDFPGAQDLKRIIDTMIFQQLLRVVDTVKRQLNIETVDVTSITILDFHALALSKLVSLAKENSINDLVKNNMFNKFEEDNDNIISNAFDLTEQDMPTIKFTVDDIKASYYDKLNDEKN